MAIPLLETKLHIPNVPSDYISRPRLTERLNTGLRRKLILISAPAGFGKTTLLSTWASTCGVPLAWLSLDAGDNDPARFLSYLAAALRTVGVAITESTPADATVPGAAEQFLTILLNQMTAVPENFVLVLDDYHLITAQAVHDSLAFLLGHMPANAHLAIATRADPPIPVARLRGRGQLIELRLPDLRFTYDETVAFLDQVMELSLSAEDIAALASRTEGWVAGLQMAGLSLQGRDDVSEFIAAFTGSNRYILDYLLEEVMRREPEHVQTFLLRTSILSQLSALLCDAVLTGSESTEPSCDARIGELAPTDSRATLEHLERANLFVVPLDEHREWYRYHRLFSDLLNFRLRQTQGGLVPELHQRASLWYERHGLANEAINHALKAENLDRAADLIEQNAEGTLMRGEVATFLRWVEALPDAIICDRPSLCVLHAWMLLLSGQPLEAVEARLQQGEEHTVTGGPVTALRGLMAAFQGHTDAAIELSELALEQLPAEDQFLRDFAAWTLSVSRSASSGEAANDRRFEDLLRMSRRTGNLLITVIALCNQAELLIKQGQLHQAATTYRKVLELATDAQGQPLPIAGQALIGLGELSREWNDLGAATRYLTEGIELTKRWTETGPLEAHICLARVKLAQANWEGAWNEIQKAQDLAVRFDITELDDLTVAMFQAWLSLARGDLAATQRWAEERDLYQYIDTPLQARADAPYDYRMHKYELLILSRLLIAQNRTEEALRVLRSLVPIVKWRQRHGLLIQIHILQALALKQQGEVEQAMKALEHALTLAQPEGYVRIFADEGESIVDLLRQAACRGIAPQYVMKLLEAIHESGWETVEETFPHSQIQALVEPLSKRELDVLRYLDTHLSSTEIADELYISPNTARFHIKNIYSKLDVHRRADAVARARELGLL